MVTEHKEQVTYLTRRQSTCFRLSFGQGFVFQLLGIHARFFMVNRRKQQDLPDVRGR